MISGLRIALIYTMVFCFAGCAAVKSTTKTTPPEPLPWTGKYVRVDGAYDLYSDWDPKTQIVVVTIVAHGKDPHNFKEIESWEFMKTSGDTATQLQRCHSNGECREFLSDLHRSPTAMVYRGYGDFKDYGVTEHDGVYR